MTVLCPPIRRKLKEIDLFGDSCKEEFARLYEKHLHLLVILRQVLLFLAPIGFFSVIDFSIVLEYFLGLVLLGLSLVVFVSIQLPLLMKAHVLATFKIGDDVYNSTILFESGKETLVEARIYNLGYITYKNFAVVFYFGPDFEIVPYDNEKYCDLDFEKKFGVQKKHGGAFFSPKDISLTIPPQEVFIFPIYVKVPKEKKQGRVHIEFYSENSWGMTNIFKPLIVNKKS
jgi:hypothetical protein